MGKPITLNLLHVLSVKIKATISLSVQKIKRKVQQIYKFSLSSSFEKFTKQCFINGVAVNMILDTGSSCALVHERLVPQDAYTGDTFKVQFAEGSEKEVPVARLTFTGPETS